jgi:hypothetical protein
MKVVEQEALLNLYKALRKQRVTAKCASLGGKHKKRRKEPTNIWDRIFSPVQYEYLSDLRCPMCRLKKAYTDATTLIGDSL